MKRFVKIAIISMLSLLSLTGMSVVNVKATSVNTYTYVHTLKNTKLYAKGSQGDSGLGDPKFNFTGISDRMLSANSDWYTDQSVDGLNQTDEFSRGFSRVATNEWVNTNEVVFVNKARTTFNMETYRDYPIFSFDAKSYSMKATNKTLPAGLWMVGTFMSFPDQASYYQVGVNQWVQMLE